MASRKKHNFYWIALVVVLAVGGVAFFSLRALSRTPAKIDAEKLARVERMDLARSVVATGKIQPTTQVEVKSKASGIILKLPVNVGDVVRQGQVICELDQNDLLPKLRQAQASLGMADAMLKSAQADYERSKVEALGPDVPFLKRDMERARQMFQEMLVPQTARDDAEKNYELAVNRRLQCSLDVLRMTGLNDHAVRHCMHPIGDEKCVSLGLSISQTTGIVQLVKPVISVRIDRNLKEIVA